MNPIEAIRIYNQKINEAMDNSVELSKILIAMSYFLSSLSDAMASALTEEQKAVLDYLDAPSELVEKKRTIAEAERYVPTQTGNKYLKLKLQRETILTMIDSLKVRITVLEENAVR